MEDQAKMKMTFWGAVKFIRGCKKSCVYEF